MAHSFSDNPTNRSRSSAASPKNSVAHVGATTATTSFAPAVISNGTVELGVNPEGHLDGAGVGDGDGAGVADEEGAGSIDGVGSTEATAIEGDGDARAGTTAAVVAPGLASGSSRPYSVISVISI